VCSFSSSHLEALKAMTAISPLRAGLGCGVMASLSSSQDRGGGFLMLPVPGQPLRSFPTKLSVYAIPLLVLYLIGPRRSVVRPFIPRRWDSFS